MSDEAYIGQVVVGAANALAPLNDALADTVMLSGLLGSLGWQFDPSSTTSAISELSALAGNLTTLESSASALANALTQAGTPEEVLSAIATALPPAVQAIGGAITELQELLGTSVQGTWPSPLDSADFWTQFPVEVLDFLIYRQLAAAVPRAFAICRSLGILTLETPQASASRPNPIPVPVAHWERLGTLLSQPTRTLTTAFFAAEPAALGSLFDAMGDALFALGLPAMVSPPVALISATSTVPTQAGTGDGNSLLVIPLWSEISSSQAAQESAYLGLVLAPVVQSTDSQGQQTPGGLLLYPAAWGTLSAGPFMLSDQIGVSLNGSLTSDQAVIVSFGPGGVAVTTTAAGTSLSGQVRLDISSGAQPWVVFGSPDASNLQIAKLHTAVSLGGSVGSPSLGFELGIDSGSLIINLADADGFLQSALGSGQQTVNLVTTIGWNSASGVALSGSPGLSGTLPVHLNLAGVLSVDSIGIALGGGGAGSAATLALTINGSLTLGPVEATVQGIGLQASLTPAPSGTPGNVGPLDLDLGFQPPGGLGLAVDATAVSGGGFISFNTSAQQYSGAVELTIEMLQLKAFGLLDTDPVSFVVIIVADFPPIELGFGFALTGVGGLLGVNRTLALDALQSAFRAHTVDNMLFLTDPVSQGPQLVQNITAVFPPMPDHFVIAPMIQLSWGEVLLTADIGLIVSFPDPASLALVGEVVVSVPDPDTPVILINLDVLGTIDFDQKTVEIQASLFNSYVLAFSLSGDMAFLLDYGESPNFILSVGGFDPKYQPPPTFPTLKPMTVALGNGGNPGLSVSGYFAITPSALMFGASVNLEAVASGFGITGNLTFHVKLDFNPFGFSFDFSVSLSILAGGKPVLSIHLTGSLSGPNPWNVQGSASFSILFFSVSVSVNATFGTPLTQAAPPTVAVIPPVQAALTDARNWQAQLPPDSGRVATLAAVAPSSNLVVVHPIGQLACQQTVIPLNITIDKFTYGAATASQPSGTSQPAAADATPSDANEFTVLGSFTTPGGAPGNVALLPGNFADDQFFDLSDAQALSEPGYTAHPAGAVLASGTLQAMAATAQDPTTPFYVTTAVSYQTAVEDDSLQTSHSSGAYPLAENVALAMSANGASALSPRRSGGAQKYISPGLTSSVEVQDPLYVVVSTTDLSVSSDVTLSTPDSYRVVQVRLAQYLDDNPGQGGTLEVIPVCELPAGTSP